MRRRSHFGSRVWLALLAGALVATLLGAPAGAGEGGPGTLDASFGNEGVVVTDLGALDTGNAIVAGTRIVVAATVQTGFVGSGGRADLALVGYLLDGTLDPSFGTGGIVVTDFEEFDRPVDLQLDDEGRVLVLVSVGDSNDSEVRSSFGTSTTGRWTDRSGKAASSTSGPTSTPAGSSCSRTAGSSWPPAIRSSCRGICRMGSRIRDSVRTDESSRH